MKGEADRLHARNLQLRAAMSAIRDIAADAGTDMERFKAIEAIRTICDEQAARTWDDSQNA